MLKASVLIVGDDATLLRLQSEMLRRWQVVTATSREAKQAIPVLAYDLLIVSQTVCEGDAHSLVARARKLQRPPKILVIRRQHREWIVGSVAFYTATSSHSCEFESAIDRLLACNQSEALDIARLRKAVS
jgi:CheY-like chemotaxis protein